MRLRKMKKNKKLNGFQLKQQTKQRKLNQQKRITNEKMKSFKTRTMKVSDFKNIKNPYEHFTNSTDDYLPLERLERDGKTILKDNNGDIIVKVGVSDNMLEVKGVFKRYDLDDLNEMSVPLKDIVDYNSLWEITKSGWDTENYGTFGYHWEQNQYPYINVDGEWFRWDNVHLRNDMGIYKWTEENTQKYINTLLPKINQIRFQDIQTPTSIEEFRDNLFKYFVSVKGKDGKRTLYVHYTTYDKNGKPNPNREYYDTEIDIDSLTSMMDLVVDKDGSMNIDKLLGLRLTPNTILKKEELEVLPDSDFDNGIGEEKREDFWKDEDNFIIHQNLDRHQVKPLFDEHKKIVGKEVIHFPYTNPNSIYVPFVNKVLGEFGLVEYLTHHRNLYLKIQGLNDEERKVLNEKLKESGYYEKEMN